MSAIDETAAKPARLDFLAPPAAAVRRAPLWRRILLVTLPLGLAAGVCLIVGRHTASKDNPFFYALYWLHDHVYLPVKGNVLWRHYPWSLTWCAPIALLLLGAVVSALWGKSLFAKWQDLLRRGILHSRCLQGTVVGTARAAHWLRLPQELLKATVARELGLSLLQLSAAEPGQAGTCGCAATVTGLQVELHRYLSPSPREVFECQHREAGLPPVPRRPLTRGPRASVLGKGREAGGSTPADPQGISALIMTEQALQGAAIWLTGFWQVWRHGAPARRSRWWLRLCGGSADPAGADLEYLVQKLKPVDEALRLAAAQSHAAERNLHLGLFGLNELREDLVKLARIAVGRRENDLYMNDGPAPPPHEEEAALKELAARVEERIRQLSEAHRRLASASLGLEPGASSGNPVPAIALPLIGEPGLAAIGQLTIEITLALAEYRRMSEIAQRCLETFELLRFALDLAVPGSLFGQGHMLPAAIDSDEQRLAALARDLPAPEHYVAAAWLARKAYARTGTAWNEQTGSADVNDRALLRPEDVALAEARLDALFRAAGPSFDSPTVAPASPASQVEQP